MEYERKEVEGRAYEVMMFRGERQHESIRFSFQYTRVLSCIIMNHALLPVYSYWVSFVSPECVSASQGRLFRHQTSRLGIASSRSSIVPLATETIPASYKSPVCWKTLDPHALQNERRMVEPLLVPPSWNVARLFPLTTWTFWLSQ